MAADPLLLRSRWFESSFRERRLALLDGELKGGRDWRGVDLRGARIDGSLPAGVRLDFAQLDGADVKNADLSGADLSFASAIESKWTHVRLTDANIAFANFAGASLVEAELDRSVLVGASFAGADLRAASLHSAALRGCDLEGAWLWGATLPRLVRQSSGLRLQARRMGYETLADVMEDGGYLQAMRMSHARIARAVEGVAWGSPFLDGEIVFAMQADWRSQIVAAAVALLGSDRLRRPEMVLASFWKALDASWASPQLAAACSLLDPSFAAHASATQPKSRQALAAMLGEANEGEGAMIALKWKANIVKWAGPAARKRWVPKG